MLYVKPDGARRYRVAEEHEILDMASAIMVERHKDGDMFTSPCATRAYFQARLAHLEHEVFCIAFLNNRHKLIQCEDMFRGTIDGAGVYPREVVKAALRHNAAAILCAHNHPSGDSEPSQADRALTQRLTAALRLIDVRCLDHLVVSHDETVSFAERGWL